MKEKISQVIVVEGRDDTANLKHYFDVETYETRGSAINDQDIERIRRLHDLHGVIVFTDPDFNGERIRRMIMTAIPTVQHAFLKRYEAAPKSKTKGRWSSTLSHLLSLGSDARDFAFPAYALSLRFDKRYPAILHLHHEVEVSQYF